jgi:hypothetical protein
MTQWQVTQREPTEGNPSGLVLSDGLGTRWIVNCEERFTEYWGELLPSPPADAAGDLLDRWRAWYWAQNGQTLPQTTIHEMDNAEHRKRESDALRSRCTRQRKELRRLNARIRMLNAESQRHTITQDRTQWPGKTILECLGKRWEIEPFMDQLWVNGEPWGPVTESAAPEPLPAGWAVGVDEHGTVSALWHDSEECAWVDDVAWICKDGTEDRCELDAEIPDAVWQALRATHKALDETAPVEPVANRPDLVNSDEGPDPHGTRCQACSGCAYDDSDPHPACENCTGADNWTMPDVVDPDSDYPPERESSPPGYLAPPDPVLLMREEYGEILDRISALETASREGFGTMTRWFNNELDPDSAGAFMSDALERVKRDE